MNEDILTFNQYWDKIRDRRKWETFTTLRGYTPERHSFFQQRITHDFDIKVNLDDVVGSAKLDAIDFVWGEDVSDEEIKRDTYADWTSDDFEHFLRKLYFITNPFLIRIHLTWSKCNESTPKLEVYNIIDKIVKTNDDDYVVKVLG